MATIFTRGNKALKTPCTRPSEGDLLSNYMKQSILSKGFVPNINSAPAIAKGLNSLSESILLKIR